MMRVKGLEGILIASVIVGFVFSTTMAFSGGKVFELRYGDQSPSTSRLWKSQAWWADELQKRTGGRVKIKMYPGEQLFSAKESLSAISTGAADLGGASTTLFKGALTLHETNYLPMLAPQRPDQQSLVMEKLKGHPLLVKECERQNVVHLFPLPVPSFQIISRDKPVQNINDLKGLKIRSVGMLAPFLKRVGAVPVTTSAPEAAMAMQRGVFDAAAGCGYYWFQAYKLDEMAKFYTEDLPLGGGQHDIFMNKKVYDALDDDIKKIIDQLRKEIIVVNQLNLAAPDYLLNFIMDNERKGVQFVYFSAKDREKMMEIARLEWKDWTDRWGSAGAKEIVGEYQKAKEEVLKEYPQGIPVSFKY